MYSGLRCKEPICDPSCKNGGTCSKSRQCVCPSTYQGRECEIPVCSPKCKFGSCKGPNFCSCYPGYTGELCETPICNPVCQNGGSCVSPNTCNCPAGKYTGPGCNIPICIASCKNGGTCSQSRQCLCPPNTYRGSDCGDPVCKQPCLNNGTCIYPDVCSCDETYTGPVCETPKCSYHSPCFPGTCGNDSVTCQCYQGFSGLDGIQRCRELTSERRPTIIQCTSVLANIERTGQKIERYRFITDSSEPNSTRVDTLWLSQKDYNYINVTFAAFYTGPENLVVPEYVKGYKFGITSGKIQIELWKVDRKDQNKPYVSKNEIKNCNYQPGSLHPNDDVFQCNFTNENFDRLLENGDNLTITVIAENGGYRELEGPGTQLKKDPFIGQSSTKSTMFRFDFKKPRHCLQERNCSEKALDVTEDITKSPIKLIWNNWMDDLSGLKGYKLQVYLLKPNTTYLSEPYPWNPLQEKPFSVTESRYSYTPPQPGMYSFILNVIDNANNTQYARTLVLYDPSSSITLSTSPFIATSAEPETNYLWQNNLKNNITVSWKGHFENKFHDTNKLLNNVSHYQHFDHMTKYEKQVPQQLDDKTGNRTLGGIPNIRGIVKFDYFHRNGNQGNRTPTSWTPVGNISLESQTFFIDRKDGNAINFWVKATDVMGNEKVDMTKIFFDSTPPEALADSDVKFTRNTKSPTYDFSSRLQVDAFDRNSGIHKVHLKLLANSSNELFHGTYIKGNKSYIDVRKEGYQLPMGDYYYYSHYIDINNCWMVVSKEKFADEFVLLNLTVYNNAMITTHYSKT
ncbi:uncharacterized protein LOC134267510, partial [Saccostrea cucullata]|uniref:uncharacterized protein LOC134267510 n=1 Tax=Saccostrea cuccullata TaxID=36930 RepID=UPI002ED4FA9D